MRTRVLFPVLIVSASLLAWSQTAPATPEQPQNTAAKNAGAAPAGASTPSASAPEATKQTPTAETSSEAKTGTTAIKPEADPIPTTTILDKSAANGSAAPRASAGDDLFEPPPLPKGKVSLVGGVVRSVDHIRDRMTIEPFGGKPMKIHFDERTHIYRDGIETTQMGIRKGDRVYVDTMLDKADVLARNVHVVTSTEPADARGQLLGFNEKHEVMTVQDELSGQPVRFRVDPSTTIKRKDGTASVGDLVRGSLISVKFSASGGNRDVAREVTLLATPGSMYTFAGEITHVDMPSHVVAIHNMSDDKTYTLDFDPNSPSARDLQIGAQATVKAEFTGRGYHAQQMTVTQAAKQEQ